MRPRALQLWHGRHVWLRSLELRIPADRSAVTVDVDEVGTLEPSTKRPATRQVASGVPRQDPESLVLRISRLAALEGPGQQNCVAAAHLLGLGGDAALEHRSEPRLRPTVTLLRACRAH